MKLLSFFIGQYEDTNVGCCVFDMTDEGKEKIIKCVEEFVNDNMMEEDKLDYVNELKDVLDRIANGEKKDEIYIIHVGYNCIGEKERLGIEVFDYEPNKIFSVF